MVKNSSAWARMLSNRIRKWSTCALDKASSLAPRFVYSAWISCFRSSSISCASQKMFQYGAKSDPRYAWQFKRLFISKKQYQSDAHIQTFDSCQSNHNNSRAINKLFSLRTRFNGSYKRFYPNISRWSVLEGHPIIHF